MMSRNHSSHLHEGHLPAVSKLLRGDPYTIGQAVGQERIVELGVRLEGVDLLDVTQEKTPCPRRWHPDTVEVHVLRRRRQQGGEQLLLARRVET